MSDGLEEELWSVIESPPGHYHVAVEGELVCDINSCASRDGESLAHRIVGLHNRQLDRETQAKTATMFDDLTVTQIRHGLRIIGHPMPYMHASPRIDILRWMTKHLTIEHRQKVAERGIKITS